MCHLQPLPDHPDLVLISYPGWREYRVMRHASWSWTDVLALLCPIFAWPSISGGGLISAGLAAVTALYVYIKCTQVLWESVIAVPSLGIQLETLRGLPSFPLLTSRRFIPLAFLNDFVINEGLRRWDVRYYLVAIQLDQGEVRLDVAFEHILPRFPVLLEVYHGVHEVMFGNLDKCI